MIICRIVCRCVHQSCASVECARRACISCLCCASDVCASSAVTPQLCGPRWEEHLGGWPSPGPEPSLSLGVADAPMLLPFLSPFRSWLTPHFLSSPLRSWLTSTGDRSSGKTMTKLAGSSRSTCARRADLYVDRETDLDPESSAWWPMEPRGIEESLRACSTPIHTYHHDHPTPCCAASE